MQTKQYYLLAMSFSKRLSVLRKNRQLTQQKLADKVGIHVVQLRRYEAADSQPTLDVIRRLAISLSVSADVLVFDKNERDPDDDLRLQFEAISQFEPEEKKIIKALLEGMILKHETQRVARLSS